MGLAGDVVLHRRRVLLVGDEGVREAVLGHLPVGDGEGHDRDAGEEVPVVGCQG